MDLDLIVRIFLGCFGLGLVIFVHELGHFMVARWAGVLVERFSLGFGPVIASFKRGDTEYAISAVPLGGYVKMLGQTDTPEVEEKSDDQRSYQNKSVGWRMGIISAGVIMNVIFGFFCFTIAYHIGVKYQPAVVGIVVPGMPAWVSGVRPGDVITSVNGYATDDFVNLLMEVALANPKRDVVRLDVKRDGKPLHFEIQPLQEEMKPVIGVSAALSLELYDQPTHKYSPAERATEPGFQAGDRIVAIDGVEIDTHRAFTELMYERQDRAVKVTVERKPEKNAERKRSVITVEPNFVRSLGLVMDIGEVTAVQNSCPAQQAVDANNTVTPILPKDRILAVDGAEFDPVRLPDIVTAKAGSPVQLTLLRPSKTGDKEIVVKVTPERTPTWIMDESSQRGDIPMCIPSLGIVYKVLPTVRSVTEGFPAATAGKALKPRDVIKKARIFYEEEGKLKTHDIEVKEDRWSTVFWSVQTPEVRKITLTVDRQGEAFEVELEPQLDKSWPLRFRGLRFNNKISDRIESTLGGALVAGLEQTRISIIRLYLQLNALVFTRTISIWNAGGPITIARVAVSAAQDNAQFILFLGTLSLNLAIINFLPIPIFDGGHMVFLTYEWIMRRRANDRVMAVANYVGLAVIIMLILCVLTLDVFRLPKPL